MGSLYVTLQFPRDDKEMGLSNEEGNGVLMVNRFPDVVKTSMHILWLIGVMLTYPVLVLPVWELQLFTPCT